MFGKQPATQEDHSTNFAPLAVISFGESWHNFHHAFPASARHGALPHQVDPSAGLIRLFERAGLASHVRWPTAAQLASCTSS
jgi:stearoyl-CoA desaturase (delta-9 desaturase)